jgi:hypothetical protein
MSPDEFGASSNEVEAATEPGWLSDRKWPLTVAILFILTGIAFAFWWGPLVEHVSAWVDSGDLWDTYRASQWVEWGNEGTVYQHGIYSIVFPGIDVALAPVAAVATHFRLVNPYPYYVPKPSALPILMPYVLVISAPTLIVFDQLADNLGVRRLHRIALCWMQGILLWPLVVLWGHPEEPIALAFAMLGLMAACKGKWSRAGWMLGFAVAFQPYALLLLPIMVGLMPRGERLRTMARASLVSVALLVLPLLQAWHATTRAILLQPTIFPPSHATPLLALAPRIGTGLYSAGPGRYLVALCALAAGWWTWKHRPSLLEVVWLSGLIFATRCVLEPVVAPNYIWAGAALLVTVAARKDLRHYSLIVAALAFASLWAYHFTSRWTYWLPIVLAFALAVVFARPEAPSFRPEAEVPTSIVLLPEKVDA